MDTVSSGAATASSSDDRAIALGGYLLLLAAPFTAGMTALVAVALAYARRPLADRLARSHYVFQIRTFWTSIFFIGLSVAAAFFAAFVLYGDVMDGESVINWLPHVDAGCSTISWPPAAPPSSSTRWGF